MTTPRILMCPPDHYGIEYEINPWMNRSMGAIRALAFHQWKTLRDTLASLGVQVELLTPQPGLPDLVFTANAGLIYKDVFVSSRFRHEVRARESPYFDAWFAEHGFQVEHLPAGMYHEGAGDALFCGDTLFAGYRIRSDALAHQWVGQRFGIRVLPLELVNPRFYHLDTCFCPLSFDEALYYPPAFDTYGRRVLQTHIPKLIEVNDAEAHRFGCNAVVVGRTVVHNSRCPELAEKLAAAGYRSIEVELDEFLKAGGSAKCLTLRLDGEDAAGWKYQ
ncbi:MAG: arginine deiminase-related protein [Thermogemmata sp.]|uniref:Amidinotransferase n=1 Tax=Thermogemmata fonticola TaxID=2755323 RepID=A0A7V8VBB8_9BACT|nr:arginine deiminase-related protein [Thermogemmata fonticola]MBA2224879.1 amidinotransferase [Thermogemmata fonticola]